MRTARRPLAPASAAAVIAGHPSTAATLTLSMTVGTWVINFVAAVHGGIWERIAGYTPTAAVDQFQHGLVRLDVVFIALTLVLAGLGVAAIWLRLGAPVSQRATASIGLAAAATAAIVVCSFARASWDVSESRGNSFPEADEQALRTIQAPLHIEVH